nr:MAG TPA: hypothetical protein [Caudoviricetes sp.]
MRGWRCWGMLWGCVVGDARHLLGICWELLVN